MARQPVRNVRLARSAQTLPAPQRRPVLVGLTREQARSGVSSARPDLNVLEESKMHVHQIPIPSKVKTIAPQSWMANISIPLSKMQSPKIVNFRTIRTVARQISAPSVPMGTNVRQLRQKLLVQVAKSALLELRQGCLALVPTTKTVSIFRQFAPMDNTGTDQVVNSAPKIKHASSEELPRLSPRHITHPQESTLSFCALEATTALMQTMWSNAPMVISVKKVLQH